MGEIAIWILFFILIAIALWGSFISKFPSSFLSLAAVLLAKFCLKAGNLISWANIAVIVILVVAAMVVTKMAPKMAKKISDYGKGGTWGTIIGSIIALFLSLAYANMQSAVAAYILIILTFIILPFLFAWLFEYLSRKDMALAVQAACAATVVYITTTFIKLFTVVYVVCLVFTNN